MNAAEKTAQTLKELGVRYVFGVPSGNWIDYLEAISRTEGIEFILVSNESSGGFMADVCWRLTGKVAACFGTYGPGACNQSTGVCCGYLDRSPMIAFSDEKSDNMLNRITQMNIDQQSFFTPITKWQTRLKSDQVEETLYKAFQTAISEVPGPVYIGLPQGIGAEKAKPEKVKPLPSKQIPAPGNESLEKMEALFNKARKPLIALGITSIRSQVRPLILKILDKFKVPVVQTPMAKGMVPEDHPLYAGVLSHALSERIDQTVQQADLIVGIGYDPVELNYEDWIHSIPLMHIDTIPADLDKNQCTLACEVIGDLKPALERLAGLAAAKKDWDIKALAQRRHKMFADLSPEEGKFEARTVLAGLREMLPPDGIMTCDVGAHLHLIGQAWKAFSPECQLMTNGCSSMGFGIPAAIAAKLSLPEREVACITGDGDFLMMAGELATAKRLGTKIIFVLMTDKELSLIRIKQERKNFKSYGTKLFGESYVSTENFFGVPVLTATTTEEYQLALKKAFAAKGPVLIEAFVNKADYEKLILK